MADPFKMSQSEGDLSASQVAAASTESSDCSQLCRLCACVCDFRTPIFQSYGEKHQLGIKIQMHLPYITVQCDDTLPLHLCHDCVSMLNRWHYFFIDSSKAEKKLRRIQAKDQTQADSARPSTSGLQNSSQGRKRKCPAVKDAAPKNARKEVAAEVVAEVAAEVATVTLPEQQLQTARQQPDNSQTTARQQPDQQQNASPIHIDGTKENIDIHLYGTLYYAAQHDNVHTVRFLVDQGLDIDEANSEGLTVFQYAAQQGSHNVMEYLKACHASFDIEDADEPSQIQLNTSLLCASFVGCLETVIKVSRMGASLSHQDIKGNTPAWLATFGGHGDVLNWLLVGGTDPKETPLNKACSEGEAEIANFIITRGDDIEARGWCSGLTPLMTATRNNKVAIMKMLLENGANKEGLDRAGNTPLHEASRLGLREAAEVLLCHAAQINKENKDGFTSLHVAVQNNNLDLVDLFLEKNLPPGEMLTESGHAGVTLLTAQAIRGDFGAVKRCLDSFCAIREGMTLSEFINKQDIAGWTVLHYLACLGQPDFILYLIGQGGDQYIPNREQNSALHVAAEYKHPETVRVLLSAFQHSCRAAAVNRRGRGGNSMMMQAIISGSVECVKLAFQARANFSQVDDRGWTPLMMATFLNHMNIVRLLLINFNPHREMMSLKDFIYMKSQQGETVFKLGNTESHNLIASFVPDN